jgi:hypothetical protein
MESSESRLTYEWTELSNLSLSLMLRPTVSRPVSLGIKRPTGDYDQYLLLSDTCWFVDVGCFIWREDGFVVYNCCWYSPAQSFSNGSPVALATIFYCLRFETSLFVASYDSQGYGGGMRPRLHTCPPSITLGRANRIEITPSNSSSVILCLSVAVESYVNFVAMLWFLQAFLWLRIGILAGRYLVMDVSAVLHWLHTSGVRRRVTTLMLITIAEGVAWQ